MNEYFVKYPYHYLFFLHNFVTKYIKLCNSQFLFPGVKKVILVDDAFPRSIQATENTY